MDPKRQISLAEDKSRVTQVSDYFPRINFTVKGKRLLFAQRGSWKLVLSCNIGPRDFFFEILRYCCFDHLKYNLVKR